MSYSLFYGLDCRITFGCICLRPASFSGERSEDTAKIHASVSQVQYMILSVLDVMKGDDIVLASAVAYEVALVMHCWS